MQGSGDDSRVEIRGATPEDASGVARVHVESWKSTYPGIVSNNYLRRMSDRAEDIEGRWRGWLSEEPQGRIFSVAEYRGEIVGFASGGPPLEEGYPGYDSWLYTIYLLAEWQGYGRGLELLSYVVNGLAEKGNRSMLLWVMADNSRARRFYESLGGKYVGEDEFDVDGTRIKEIAYGWGNISQLTRRD